VAHLPSGELPLESKQNEKVNGRKKRVIRLVDVRFQTSPLTRQGEHHTKIARKCTHLQSERVHLKASKKQKEAIKEERRNISLYTSPIGKKKRLRSSREYRNMEKLEEGKKHMTTDVPNPLHVKT
jgi:hypothetical protein